MFKKPAAIAGICLILVSCSGNGEGKKEEAAKQDTRVAAPSDSCSRLLAKAKASDAVLMRAVVLDKDVARKAIGDFSSYASYCENDSLSPVFYLKAGQVAQAIGSYSQAQAMLNNCLNKYPRFSNKGAVLFLLAQLYDDPKMLNDEPKAKEYYEQIIKEYPKSPYANDAIASIKNLGKTDEELIQEFLKKNK
jgi:tetratricopeptide (TPR) repeat protein